MPSREETLARAFLDSPVPMSIHELDGGRIVELNDAFLKVSGLGREQVIGRSGFELGIWPDDERDDALCRQLVAGGEIQDRHIRYRTGAGEVRAGLMSARVVRYEGRDCALAVVVDVTDRVRLEEQLRQVQKMEALGQLAGGIAHDFNNLLQVIGGQARSLLSAATDQATITRLLPIVRAAESGVAMTRQLLDFSRRRTLNRQPVDLNAVVGEIAPVLQRLLGDQIVVDTRLAQNVPLVSADHSQLHQVILNLAVNARDAMPRGGSLLVTTSEVRPAASDRAPGQPPGHFVRLAVRDTGEGMDSETLRRVFEPFFTTRKRGTGMGLATVHAIVTRSAGFIRVASQPGCGTEILIDLPADSAQPADCSPGSAAYATALLVDDDDDIRTVVRELLEQAGLRVLDASGAEEALRVAEIELGPIAVLVTDVRLGGRSGVELARELRRSRPGMGTVFVTGQPLDLPLGSRARMLVKPCTARELIEAIQQTLADATPSPSAAG